MEKSEHKPLAKRIYVFVVVAIAMGLLLNFIPFFKPYTSWITPPIVLFLGLLFAMIFGQPFSKFNKKMSKHLLQYAVVGLGFGMNLHAALASGKEGMSFTIISVFGTLALGWIIGKKLLRIDTDTSYLIGSGTAICGGSAIAAVGPIIGASEASMSVSLGIIFILNAIALFIFPIIGHALELSQQAFGTWAAIAIHDTSSVVGAGVAYGEEALRVATTVKLTRALWIIPVALLTSVIFRQGNKQIRIPWFIFFFILAMLANTYLLTSVPQVGEAINAVARKALTLTMFFIGASLSRDVLKRVGLRPMVLGILLWIIISVSSLLVILWAE